MTTPRLLGSSGAAWNAAKRFPSAASRTRSSCATAAPRTTGIGGSESSSKHTAPPTLQRRRHRLLGNGARLVAAAVEAERRILVRHQQHVRPDPEGPPVEPDNEVVQPARVASRDEEREPGDHGE